MRNSLTGWGVLYAGSDVELCQQIERVLVQHSIKYRVWFFDAAKYTRARRGGFADAFAQGYAEFPPESNNNTTADAFVIKVHKRDITKAAESCKL